jgi:GT2 family glycosyltransferase
MSASPTPSRPHIAVVIITLNGAQRISGTLEHLLALPEQPEIIVVDNGSRDGTTELVRARFPTIRVVQAGRNLGAAGRTLGVRATDAPYVAFAEDDSWYAPGALARAAAILDAHPSIGLIQAHVFVGEAGRPDPIHADMVDTPVSDAPELPGHPILSFLEGVSIVRRDAFLAAGGFSPRIFVGGVEEHLAAELLTAGLKLRYVPEIVAHHHPDHGQPSAFVRRLGVRNTLWFAWSRRPLGPALQWTAHVLRQSGLNRITLAGFGLALLGLPRILLRDRRPLPPAVERQMALLDAPKRQSQARDYSVRPRATSSRATARAPAR